MKKWVAFWRSGWGMWCLVVIGVALLAFIVPFRYRGIRIALLLGVVGIWAGALVLTWKWVAARVACLAFALLPAAVLFLPERPIDTAGLRAEYLRALRSYEGLVYVWGGETRTGIDCSGLMRRALIDAELDQGIRTGNAALLREATRLWWFDCSAKALGEEYRGFTQSQYAVPSLNEMNYDRLLPGDMAVTMNGSHILAYLSNRTWIQADPVAWRVTINRIPDRGGMFVGEAQIVRWRILQ